MDPEHTLLTDTFVPSSSCKGSMTKGKCCSALGYMFCTKHPAHSTAYLHAILGLLPDYHTWQCVSLGVYDVDFLSYLSPDIMILVGVPRMECGNNFRKD